MANSALPWQLCFFFTPASSGHHKTSRLVAPDMHPASIRSVTMKVVAGLILMLLNMRFSHSCTGEGQILFCVRIPPAFRPGYSSLVMFLKDVGEINSTVLRSDNLTSVTRLRIEDAGVTGIAEGAFSSFQNLTNLSLNQNLLTDINPNWFGRPDVLSELSLTENQIQILSESMLNGLSNLSRLSLSKNRITTIDPNSFNSQTTLAELDLSANRMTWVSPQVFRSLRSTRIRLDGNPWDCSCGAEDSVDFLKDIQSRSLLDRQMEVTCESPPSLRGRPVWNVSECVTPPPRPPPVTPTVHAKPTDILTEVPASTSAKVVTTPPSRPSSKTSGQPKPTDAPRITSSHTARPPSETKTSVQPRPSDILTTVTTSALNTAANVTSPPSVMQTSVHPKPSDLTSTMSTVSAPTGTTETCVTTRPSSDVNTVCTLIVVIMVLSSLLFVACFLAMLRWRKRNSKTVMPGCPEEKRNELKEDGRSSRAQSSGHSEEKNETSHWDSEMGWRRSFAGVRAKSANAILLMSPSCAPVGDKVTVQAETEAQSKEVENQDGEQKLGDETEADGGVETDNAIHAGRNLDENFHHVSVNADAVPYLSIGTNQSKPSPDDFNQQSTDGSGQRSQTGKVLGRISTWPPTAAQWRARCKLEEEEEEDVFIVWTPKFPDEVTKVKKEEHPSGSDQDQKEDDTEKNQIEDPLKMTVALMKFQSSNQNHKSTSPSEALTHTDTRLEDQDPANARQTQNLNQDLKSAENPAHKNTKKKSSSEAEKRNEPKRAVGSRQTGSKAPSGGASPDDETLQSGNEYAFMDLLHEVVQNNGRWTRERWKQMQANKHRRQDRGTEGV